MKFELMLSSSSDQNLLILAGNGPHRPKDTRESTFKLESFVRVVKKESMEKLLDRVVG